MWEKVRLGLSDGAQICHCQRDDLTRFHSGGIFH